MRGEAAPSTVISVGLQECQRILTVENPLCQTSLIDNLRTVWQDVIERRRVMEIGSKLKNARTKAGLTQEKVAEEISVSRQTVSNWENEKSYPDIISVIKLSDLYDISLDILLKGDDDMMKHLEESTDVVSSNKKLLTAIGINAFLVVLFVFFNGWIAENRFLMAGSASIAILSTTALFYQIIKKI